ncbi:transcription factor Adf-1 isoform X2 [Drosophila eugracilis]|uniref:transcription factor Adf-1 isoform X2 n=1 Tax=Drosophila eugracilis TaxID=29029 RepID=UPI001BDAA196|nr:transcription factor Adf-1 isoform X2 [Drosophila eugracilis]
MDDVELIKLIENHPILYDKDSARSVKNAAQKDAAWKAISLKLGASERACITRWKSIRDRFGKEFRRFQERPDEPTYWDMFPRLLFLKDHYKQGLAKNESLDGIRFEPRERKKRQKVDVEQEKRRKDEEEEDCQDDLLNEQLIELVKMHPVLYDRHKIRVSKNLTAKNEAWREISENLNVSEELCYNRWKKMRDRFAREYRRHFRKGVPLILENIKRRGRPPKTGNPSVNPTKQQEGMVISNGEQIWGADYPYSTDNDELEDELELAYNEEIEILSEDEQATPYDFILSEATPSQNLEPPQQLQVTTTTPAMSEEIIHTIERANPVVEEMSSLADDSTPAAATSDKLLTTVIANMETVLQQSRELQAQIQHEQEQERDQRNATPSNSLLAKAQMLLDGLSPLERANAERKIVQFLCQCQIKALDGEEIEDVAPCQVIN